MSTHHSQPKQSSSLFPLSIIFVILLGTGLYWHFSKVGQLEKQIAQLESETQSPATPTTSSENPSNMSEAKTYTNEDYQYILRYPSHLTLTPYTSEKAVLGVGSQGESSNEQVTITVLEAKTNAEKKLSVTDFIEKRVKLLCDASGGGVSVTCPEQKSLEPLSLASGLSAYTLTLERQERTIGPEASVETDEVLFFVVDISTEGNTQLVVIYPVGEGSSEVARTIAESVSRAK